MTNAQIARAVAKVTGETVAKIHQMGFVLDLPDSPLAGEPENLWLDCPFCGQAVHLSDTGLDGIPESAECHSCDTSFAYQYEEIYESSTSAISDRRQLETAAALLAG